MCGVKISIAFETHQPVEKCFNVGESIDWSALQGTTTLGNLADCGEIAPFEGAQQQFEAFAIVAEANDYELCLRLPGTNERPGTDEQVNTLRDDQLTDEGNDGTTHRIEFRDIRECPLVDASWVILLLDGEQFRPLWYAMLCEDVELFGR